MCGLGVLIFRLCGKEQKFSHLYGSFSAQAEAVVIEQDTKNIKMY